MPPVCSDSKAFEHTLRACPSLLPRAHVPKPLPRAIVPKPPPVCPKPPSYPLAHASHALCLPCAQAPTATGLGCLPRTRLDSRCSQTRLELPKPCHPNTVPSACIRAGGSSRVNPPPMSPASPHAAYRIGCACASRSRRHGLGACALRSHMAPVHHAATRCLCIMQPHGACASRSYTVPVHHAAIQWSSSSPSANPLVLKVTLWLLAHSA